MTTNGLALLVVGDRGPDLLLGHCGEALIELGELAREVAIAAPGSKSCAWDGVATSREL
jgi:hypothetical protein